MVIVVIGILDSVELETQRTRSRSTQLAPDLDAPFTRVRKNRARMMTLKPLTTLNNPKRPKALSPKTPNSKGYICLPSPPSAASTLGWTAAGGVIERAEPHACPRHRRDPPWTRDAVDHRARSRSGFLFLLFPGKHETRRRDCPESDVCTG